MVPNSTKRLREVALDAKVLVVDVVANFFKNEKRSRGKLVYVLYFTALHSAPDKTNDSQKHVLVGIIPEEALERVEG